VERPDASLEPVERRVRAIADTEAAEWVDLSLRYLWRALAESGGPVPEITCVRAGQMGIEVLVDPPCPIAPEGYVVADEGHAWRLDPDISRAELKERAKGHSPLVPALLTVGDTPEGAVLLDLERAGTLSIEGDAERVAGFLAGAALEMATAPWATDTPVCLLGGDGRLGSLDLVEVIGDPDRFVARIETQLSGDNHSTVAARVAGGGLEGWAPVVVVAAPGGADPDVVRHLAGLAPSSGAGLVVVAPGPVPGAGWRLVIAADGNAVLEPLGMELTARVDRETVSTLTALVTGASAGEPQGPDHPRSDGVPDDMALRAPVVAGDLFVGVLGPVVVEGPTLEGDIRPKLVEVVAYLAAHQDERVDGERLRSALWPLRDDDPFAGDVLDATFRSTVSRARAALGTHPSGSYHLPRPENGAYQLGPGVMCDWTRFKTLVRQAHAGSSGDEAGLLSEALGLVRGPPFAGHPRGQYGWAWSELIVSEMEVAIADAAEELAERAVASGDHDTAMWAARQGLVVAPYRESLYRCRMEAAAGTGDLDGIRRVYDEARRAAEELGALGEPEPETVELYERLLDTASARLPAGAVHS